MAKTKAAPALKKPTARSRGEPVSTAPLILTVLLAQDYA